MTPQVPILAMAQVTALTKPGVLQVVMKVSGQGPTLTVRMGYEYADYCRVNQKALPQIGTWGLVAFPGGDVRSGIWLCSVYPSFLDNLTTTGPNGQFAATDAFIDYRSHFSGHWDILTGSGMGATQWADGSTFTAGFTGIPTIYRHTVDANQNQIAVAYPQSERVPSPPPTFPFQWTQANTGTSITVDTSGNVTINVGAGAAVDFTQGGAVSDAMTLVSKMVAKFNAHTHSDPQGGTTGTPTTPLVSGDISSAIVRSQD